MTFRFGFSCWAWGSFPRGRANPGPVRGYCNIIRITRPTFDVYSAVVAHVRRLLRLARLQLLDDLGGLNPKELSELKEQIYHQLDNAGSQPEGPETRQ